MKNLNLWLAGLVFGLFLVATPALAVAIDDSITPQNCDRSNPACAQFVDTTSAGQIKWGGLVAGGLRSLTNLFVDGKLGVGTLHPNSGEQVLKVDVIGAVGARYYCDEFGNHCVRGDSLNSSSTNNGSVNITQGDGILVNQTINNAFNIAIDPTKTQRRITGVCDGASAIKKVNQDGTVVCQNVTGNVIGSGDQLWATSTKNGSNIFNKNSGNVGIGTNDPTAKLQISTDGTNVYFDSGNGIYAVTNKTDGLGVTGHSIGSGETYGGRFIATNIGAFFKGGKVGLYATDNTTDRSDGNKIPSKLLSDAKAYAGYFDGAVNINGDLNINGNLTVNGKPISGGTDITNNYKLGEQCGMFTYGVAASVNIPCAGVNIYKGSGDKTEVKNFQCPAKFTLAGGDFQSPGNRVMYTCVRSSN